MELEALSLGSVFLFHFSILLWFRSAVDCSLCLKMKRDSFHYKWDFVIQDISKNLTVDLNSSLIEATTSCFIRKTLLAGNWDIALQGEFFVLTAIS